MMTSTAPSNSSDLIVSDAFKRYTDSSGRPVQVLKGFSWVARAGQITGLIGANGSGKTTMFHAIIGAISLDAGSIQLGAHDLTTDIDHARQQVAWLPEHPGLPKMSTGRDVLIEYAALAGLSRTAAATAISRVGEELNITDYWDRTCGGYSRGQAVLVSLARFSLVDRPIWLLDEPTAGLDFEHAARIRLWMKDAAAQGKTVVVSTHVLADIKDLSGQVVGLFNGQSASPEKMVSWLGSWAMDGDAL